MARLTFHARELALHDRARLRRPRPKPSFCRTNHAPDSIASSFPSPSW
jgi:hypothetical protein